MTNAFTVASTDQEQRLFEMLTQWAIVVDFRHVNLDDLVNSSPGAIVRCTAPPADCVQLLIPPDDDAIGCVAGWVSEE